MTPIGTDSVEKARAFLESQSIEVRSLIGRRCDLFHGVVPIRTEACDECCVEYARARGVVKPPLEPTPVFEDRGSFITFAGKRVMKRAVRGWERSHADVRLYVDSSRKIDASMRCASDADAEALIKRIDAAMKWETT